MPKLLLGGGVGWIIWKREETLAEVGRTTHPSRGDREGRLRRGEFQLQTVDDLTHDPVAGAGAGEVQ